MKAKQLNEIDWVKRAESCDSYRPNLSDAYCDGKRVSATDGHRLHMWELSSERAPGYWNGKELGQFPTIDQVIPNASELVDWFEVRFERKDIQQLKALAKLSGKKTTYCRINLPSKSNGNTAMISLHDAANVVAGISFHVVESDCKYSQPVFLNLEYFTEALIEGLTARIYLGNANTDKAGRLSTVVVRYEAEKLQAIIMPISAEMSEVWRVNK